ncbi:MAG: ATP synthase subunit I [Proteobacteria bacterium]|nr:ATP synthase subunit I [Pseudomonadota bacterium]
MFKRPGKLEYRPLAVENMRRMRRVNLIVLGVLVTLSLAAWNLKFTLGVTLGGLIVMINFQILMGTVKKVLTPGHSSPTRTAILTYYLRLGATAIVIATLIIAKIVDPIGLLVGLSVVVAGAFVLLLSRLKKNPSREAA